jgi:hypothetical protein
MKQWGFPGAIRSHPLVFLFGLAAVSLLGLLFVPPIPQTQDLSPVRRPADAARHPEFLERGFQPAVHRWSARWAAISAATCRPACFSSACS